ncbi:MAG: putative Ig domain-containing protein [Candidatus Omnitrophota bacterium]
MKTLKNKKLLVVSILSIVFSLILSNNFARAEKSEWKERQKIFASDDATGQYFGEHLCISGDVAILGARPDYYDTDHASPGAAYIFRRVGNAWVQEQKLLASDGKINDEFGHSVSISGDRAIVGAHWGNKDPGWASDEYDDQPYGDKFNGAAYIFEYDKSTSQWIEKQKLLASDGKILECFGYSVSISGDTAIVGALNAIKRLGSAYIFEYDKSTSQWIEKQKLLASNRQSFFGSEVSISGDRAIVGATRGYHDRSPDAAYIFRRVGNTWVEEQELLASGGGFGQSVSISGDRVIVGAPWTDYVEGKSSGSAYIFEYDKVTSKWVQQKLSASNREQAYTFGQSVSISGDRAIVSAHHSDDKGKYSGPGYIFRRVGNTWVEEQKLLASDIAHRWPEMVERASISGDTVIVSAHHDNVRGDRSGSAFIYEFKETKPTGYSPELLDADLDRNNTKEILYAEPIDGLGSIFIHALVSEDKELEGWPVIIGGKDTKEYVAIAAGNLDDEPDLEVVVAVDGSVHAYHYFDDPNDGDTLIDTVKGFPVEEPLEGTITSLTLCDIDNDGDLDIIVADSTNTLYIIDNKGNVSKSVKLDAGIYQVAIGRMDLEEDAYTIAVKLTEDADNTVKLLDKDLKTTAEWSIGTSDNMGSGFPILADLTGDRNLEIILPTDKMLYVFDKEGNVLCKDEGGKWPVDITPCVKDIKHRTAVGDLNDDGIPEIISSRPNLHVLNYDGTVFQNWPSSLDSSIGWTDGPPIILDVNGDLSNDVITARTDKLLHAYDDGADIINGWPKPKKFEVQTEYGGIADDINDDRYVEVVTMLSEGKIHIDSLDQAYLGDEGKWPLAHHDIHRTRCYNFQLEKNKENNPPVFSGEDYSIPEGKLLEFDMIAEDPDGDTLTYSVKDLPRGADFDNIFRPSHFSWIPDYTQGRDEPYYVTFMVFDGIETATVTIPILVIDIYGFIDLKDTYYVNEMEELRFSALAIIPDGEKLDYLVEPLPRGSIFDKNLAEFNWTPDYEQAGIYKVMFTINCESFSCTKKVTIIVKDTNRPPEIKHIESKTVNEGELLEFNITAHDPDGDILTYSIDNLPEGAKFADKQGIFSWTPGYYQGDRFPGKPYPIAVTASDGKGGKGRMDVIINVVDVENNELGAFIVTVTQLGYEDRFIENATVIIYDNDEITKNNRIGKTNALGVCEFYNVPWGPYFIEASAPGYKTWGGSVFRSDRGSVIPVEAELAKIRLKGEDLTSAINLHIYDDETKFPISKALVKVKGTNKSVISNNKGNCTIKKIDYGYYVFTVQAEGYWTESFNVCISTWNIWNRNVALTKISEVPGIPPPPGTDTITGRFTSMQNIPIPNEKVYIVVDGKEVASTVTDSSGRFEFKENVPAGKDKRVVIAYQHHGDYDPLPATRSQPQVTLSGDNFNVWLVAGEYIENDLPSDWRDK